MTDTLLTLTGLTKAYPGVIANDSVSFEIGAGEIHALLGENGAGKSTLVKMIYGLVAPDAGEMRLSGAPYRPADPKTARAAGVAMVFQHFSLFEALDVAENIALGMETPPPRRTLAARIREISHEYGLPLDPARRVGDLSAGERQRVEIIRCLLQAPKLLIMDEPTSVLTPQEVAILFETLAQLRREGTSILYISHKLEEIRAICDKATILRHGKIVGECDPKAVSAREMAEQMIGSSLSPAQKRPGKTGAVVLELDNVSVASPRAFGTALTDISLQLRAHEILGIGGVAGNGQDELLMALSGELRLPATRVQLLGNPVGHLGPDARRKQGLLSAPEERMGHAAAPDLSLTENALLTGRQRKQLARRGFIDWGATRRFAEEVIARFDVRSSGAESAARALSGGNLQKFLIGREILQDPAVLVVNQPTWGVDAAAAAAIRHALIDLAESGVGVIVISQDLDELMEVSDRFAALNGGRLTAPVPSAGLSVDEIGLMLGGAHDMEVAHAQ